MADTRDPRVVNYCSVPGSPRDLPGRTPALPYAMDLALIYFFGFMGFFTFFRNCC